MKIASKSLTLVRASAHGAGARNGPARHERTLLYTLETYGVTLMKLRVIKTFELCYKMGHCLGTYVSILFTPSMLFSDSGNVNML